MSYQAGTYNIIFYTEPEHYSQRSLRWALKDAPH